MGSDGSGREGAITCPDDGNCTFEVLQNRSLDILEDNLGKLYQEISEGDKLVLKFEYKRNEIPDTVDSHYRELIFVEFDPKDLPLELRDSALKKNKVLFARWCYCKGQTGYYEVDKGILTITKEKNNYRLGLEFKIDEVPQIITSIDQSFALN